MIDFYVKVIIYFISFLLAFYGLNAIDYNRFLKQGKVLQGQVLYLVLTCSLAYLFANFLMNIIYRFN